jgi:hypothetical protein
MQALREKARVRNRFGLGKQGGSPHSALKACPPSSCSIGLLSRQLPLRGKFARDEPTCSPPPTGLTLPFGYPKVAPQAFAPTVFQEASSLAAPPRLGRKRSGNTPPNPSSFLNKPLIYNKIIESIPCPPPDRPGLPQRPRARVFPLWRQPVNPARQNAYRRPLHRSDPPMPLRSRSNAPLVP